MTVALIAETGVQLLDVPTLLDELRIPIRTRFAASQAMLEMGYRPPYKFRRYVKMDDHTYVEKD